MVPAPEILDVPKKQQRPFRRAVFRGLAIVMPPLLTIVVFIWGWSLIDNYVLFPIEATIARGMSYYDADPLATVPQDLPADAKQYDKRGNLRSFTYQNRQYKRAKTTGEWIGRYDWQYWREHFLDRRTVLLIFVPVFVLVLYFLGKFVAAGVGRILVNGAESLVHRIPLISNVYSSVKQVTDFVFTEREIEFNRVVAVEYPRKGIWSIGFVTGESMLDIRSAANEPVLSVLMPTSPMPVTGFTITVLKSEAVDLNLTVDQAIQFIVSCGVIVPRQQQIPSEENSLSNRIPAAIPQHSGNNGEHGNGKRADEATDKLESSGP